MRVLVRADADAVMGTGHIMRCLAVAEALVERGVTVTFAAARLTDSLHRRLSDAGMVVEILEGAAGGDDDLRRTVAVLNDSGGGIIDGYHFGAAYRQALAGAGRPLAVFDDEAKAAHLWADVVINAAPAAADMGYGDKAPGATLLLGPRYAPLRREIRIAAARPLLPLAARDRVLVSFGGSDPAGLTGPSTARLLDILPTSVGIDMVVGGSNPRVEPLRALAAALGPRVTLHIDTPAMGTLMRRAGLAVSAGGGTVGELAALRTPTLVVVVADNQAPAAAALGAAFATVDARGNADAAMAITQAAAGLWNDIGHRSAMIDAMGDLAHGVDGQGALRIADALLARIRR